MNVRALVSNNWGSWIFCPWGATLVSISACWTRISSDGFLRFIWEMCFYVSPLKTKLLGKNVKVAMPIFWISNHLQPKVKGICTGLHPRCFSQRALEHYCIAVCLRWSGMLWPKFQKDGIFGVHFWIYVLTCVQRCGVNLHISLYGNLTA